MRNMQGTLKQQQSRSTRLSNIVASSVHLVNIKENSAPLCSVQTCKETVYMSRDTDKTAGLCQQGVVTMPLSDASALTKTTAQSLPNLSLSNGTHGLTHTLTHTLEHLPSPLVSRPCLPTSISCSSHPILCFLTHRAQGARFHRHAPSNAPAVRQICQGAVFASPSQTRRVCQAGPGPACACYRESICIFSRSCMCFVREG